MTRTAVVDRAIDVSALLAETADTTCGATSVFLGTVRDANDGRPVTGIDYSAYHAMAERELSAIADEAANRYGLHQLVIEHRVGTLGLGDISVAIVVAHPHRGQALDATRYVIEELKQRVPIWKLEHYVGGEREWVNASTGRANGEQGSGVRPQGPLSQPSIAVSSLAVRDEATGGAE